MKTITHNNTLYPHFQAEGYAAKFAIPYAQQVCRGSHGYDIGCMREEWAFPGAYPIDLDFDDEWHALRLPRDDAEYIFSSHCLEHLHDWVNVLDYWTKTLKTGGTLFLYLPDYSQTYWRPWHNKKHKNIFTPEIIRDYMTDNNYDNIFSSGTDLNNSFMIFGEKR